MAIRIPAPTRPGAARGVSLPAFWAVSLGCLLFAYLALDNRFLRDYWQHVAAARAAAERGDWLVRRDWFTFTVAGEPLVNSDWLAQRILLLLHQTGGLELARALNAGLLLAGFACLGWACWKRSGRGGAALAAVGAALACALQSLTLRPQSFSVALACCTLALLEASRTRPLARWGIPPLMALWANLHGAFPLGWLLVALDRCGRRSEPPGARAAARAGPAPGWPLTWAADLACLAAPLAHPQAALLLPQLLRNAARSRGRWISEWMAPAPGSPAGFCLLLAALGTIGMAWWLWQCGRLGRLPAGEGGSARAVGFGVRALALGLPAALSARMVAWFGIGMAPAWAEALAGLRPPSRERPRRIGHGALVLPILLAVAALPWLRPVLPGLPEARRASQLGGPLAAAAWMAERGARGKLWAPFDWAGYLEWTGFGAIRVFADGRVDLYPDPVWEDYRRVEAGGPEALRVLEIWQVDWVVLERHRSPRLEGSLRGSTAWSLAHQDELAAVFKNNPAGLSGRRGSVPGSPASTTGLQVRGSVASSASL